MKTGHGFAAAIRVLGWPMRLPITVHVARYELQIAAGERRQLADRKSVV